MTAPLQATAECRIPDASPDRLPAGAAPSQARLLANTLFTLFLVVNLVLIVIGTFFRGPNWSLVVPW